MLYFKRLVVTLSVALLFGLTTNSLMAAVPAAINYQGFLTNPTTGAPLNTAATPLTITFNVWDAVTAGNLIYSEKQSVTFTNGVFNVQIGTGTVQTPPNVAFTNVAFDKPYWLEIVVGAETLTPRQPLLTSPYAMRAVVAEAISPGATVGSNSTVACDAAHAGGLRWNAVAVMLEVCDGSAWKWLVPVTPTYSIGGAVSGLNGTVVLQNNSGNNLSVSTNGSFTFSSLQQSASPYNVTVLTQPANQTCTLSGGTGNVASANVTNVAVVCGALIPKTVATSSGDGQTGVAGTSLANPFAVLVTDGTGRPIQGVTVNWVASTGGGNVGSATSVTNASGIASQIATLGTAGGTNTFTATVTGLSPITFSATAAKVIAISSGNGQTLVAGASNPIAVLVTDGAGKGVPGILVSWAVTSSSGVLSQPTSITNANGIATASIASTIAGNVTCTATVAGLTGSPVMFTLTVGPSFPALILAGSGVNVAAGLPMPMSVVVRDQYYNVVPGVTVNWAASAGGGSVGSPTSVTNSTGTATQLAIPPTVAGTYTYTATVAGLTPAPLPVIVVAGPGTNMIYSSGAGQTGTAGTILANPLAVRMTDFYGNVVQGEQVTWSATTGGGSVNSSTSLTDATGTATMAASLGSVPGINTYTASVQGLMGVSVVFSATGN